MRRLPATILVVAVLASAAAGQPAGKPDFESDYTRPTPEQPNPRHTFFEYVDVAALVVALAAASYLALRMRSRRAMFVLMALSLLYFGFYREGCVCSIGSVQNVAPVITDAINAMLDWLATLIGLASESAATTPGPGYVIPLTVAAFFLLPLVATLLFGRIFCAGVCPLGAIQDLLLLRPVRLPRAAEHALGMLPYVYLGAAVLFAATGSAFIICQYDPFVAFFRLSAEPAMWVLGACVLLIGVFVGRPYCRFICPYGVLLRHLSKLSWRHVTITPDECIQCRLCEDACPFGAINEPTPEPVHGDRRRGKGVLAGLILLLPVLVAAGGLLGRMARDPLARMHPTVRTAERVRLEALEEVEGTNDLSDAFWHTDRPVEELYARAGRITDRFATGGMLLGGFLGLVFGLKLIELSVRRARTDYEADRARCVSCGRCFRYCPRERLRLKTLKGAAPGEQT